MANETKNNSDINLKQPWSEFAENGNINSSATSLEDWVQFLEILAQQTHWCKVVYVVWMYTVFVVGLTWNLLNCVVIYCDKSMHTAVNYYLFALAVSEILVTFGVLLEMYANYSESWMQYTFGRVACKIHFFLLLTLWNNGILILTALAVERYVAICYPFALKSKSMRRRVLKIIAVIWIVAIIESLPEIWTVDLIVMSRSSMCFTVPTRVSRIVNIVMGLVTFVMPLGIMIFVYSMIAFEVHIMHKKITYNNIFSRRSREKVNKLVVALTLSFLLCWLPFFMMRVLFFTEDISQATKFKKWWKLCFEVMLFNTWFSTVLNPLVFSLLSSKFRRSLKRLWYQKIRRQQLYLESQ